VTRRPTVLTSLLIALLSLPVNGSAQEPSDSTESTATEPGSGTQSQPEVEPAPVPSTPQTKPEPSAPDAPASPDPTPPGDASGAPEPEAPQLSVGASAGLGSAGGEVDVSPSAAAFTDEAIDGPAADALASRAPVLAGSHLRRPMQRVEGALVLDSPMPVGIQGQDLLHFYRQRSGFAIPDTAAALGVGAAGTGRLFLRTEAPLVLVNGRRVVASPMVGARGEDLIDINQIPINLIERIEVVKGATSGLYGSGGFEGAANFVTRREFDGLEVDLGALATDGFEQHEEDINVTVGVGDADAGATATGSYFTRRPLAASDRDFIGERRDRLDSLLGNPGTFLQLPAGRATRPDPNCNVLADGYGTDNEMRLQEFGRIPDSGDISGLEYVPQGRIDEALGELDSDPKDGLLLGREISTFCTNDFSRHQDLVLQEQRLQGYSTFWYGLGDHAEAIGELGYYRTENKNRTAPSFPILASDERLFVPARVALGPDDPNENVHRDIPVIPGFTGVGGTPQSQAFIGRAEGNFTESRAQQRRGNVFRSVFGFQGDFGQPEGSLMEDWDWELIGTYTLAEQITRTPDVLTDALVLALNSCNAPTIKERQEAGCYNPFLTSVLNNAVLNPLDVDVPSGIDTSASVRGYPATDTDGDGLQDGGFICDPNDPDYPCPAGFDEANAGTVNTAAAIDAVTGEAISETQRSLFVVDAVVRGGLAEMAGGELSYSAGAQYRRETLRVDHDDVYNNEGYAFLFGGPDVHAPARDIFAGFAELRVPVLKGLELQGAGRVEHFERTGAALGALGAVAVRPFALGDATPTPATEWLLVRGGYSRGFRAPSLNQLHGVQTTMQEVDRQRASHFVPYRINGNPDADFESIDALSAGVQWDYEGIHVGLDGWLTMRDDVIATDNAMRLVNDCEARFQLAPDFEPCDQVKLSATDRILYIDVEYDNMASVDSNGVDGELSYTLDGKHRGMGEIGTFYFGLRGSLLNSYEISGTRVLREFYRSGPAPADSDDVGDAGEPLVQTATFEAAGERNFENFAPPLPKLRANLPLRWSYDGHMVGATANFISGYHDQSENTIEELEAEEDIAAMLTVDLMYGFSFGDNNWESKISVGVINIADQDPPAVQGPLGYEVGIHDPRGRVVYARISGKM